MYNINVNVENLEEVEALEEAEVTTGYGFLPALVTLAVIALAVVLL